VDLLRPAAISPGREGKLGIRLLGLACRIRIGRIGRVLPARAKGWVMRGGPFHKQGSPFLWLEYPCGIQQNGLPDWVLNASN
jgi:hypothetical protein